MANQNTNPVTQSERDEIMRLHAEGHGRNEIARQIGRGTRTVSVVAAEMGLSFDRTHTAVATAARMTDARARRAALIDRYYEQAHKALDRLDREEHEITEVSLGKAVRYTTPELPPHDVRALLLTSTAASSQAAKLEALDGDPGTEAARSMLTSLADGIRRLAGAPEDDTGED